MVIDISLNMKDNLNSIIKRTVRLLRKNCTESEKILWEVVRNRKLNGKKFQRQFPIKFELFGQERFFIADFYCHEAKLVVEIDGPIHDLQKDYDEMRTNIIKILGIKVVRISNEDIEINLDKVITIIKEKM